MTISMPAKNNLVIEIELYELYECIAQLHKVVTIVICGPPSKHFA